MVKLLTVKQPWASALLLCKDVENRSWRTTYRGWIIILAGKATDWDAPDSLGDPLELPHGAVIGAINLIDVVNDSTSEWAEHGCWHWCHDPQTAITLRYPIPWRGSLGLVNAPADLIMTMGRELAGRGQLTTLLGLT